MIIDFLSSYLGQVPEGFEIVQYVVASQILIFVLCSILKLFAGLINLFKAGD